MMLESFCYCNTVVSLKNSSGRLFRQQLNSLITIFHITLRLLTTFSRDLFYCSCTFTPRVLLLWLIGGYLADCQPIRNVIKANPARTISISLP